MMVAVIRNKRYALIFLLSIIILFTACNSGEESSIKDLRVCTSLIDPSHKIDTTLEIVGNPALFWPEDTRQLKVEFIDGDPEIQAKVMSTAKEWEKYCGISFIFGKFSNPDITISFKNNGSSSYIGTDSRKHRPSMNFGWFDKNTTQTEYNRVVLHEFGHALGFYHEHQNEIDNPIVWDKIEVNRYYKAPPNNWSPKEIQTNIYTRYEFGEKNGTSFDPLSIMIYAIPEKFTINQFHVDANDKLSSNDKKFALGIYPK